MNNTLNPSLGPDSPQDFYTGSYMQEETSFNLDLQKQFGDTSVAGGFEWRDETFEITAGEEASWVTGPLAEQGFNVGSHGFPGFTDSSAGSFDRDNYAVYVDVESQVSNELLLGGALRYEDFSTFGSTTNYKLTAHYTVNDMLAVRASHSTGFRAPTMGQANVVNTQTTFNETAELIQVQTLPAEFLGEAVLQPEESESWAVGLILTTEFADITVDAYQIEVTDRVALTPPQDISVSQEAALVAAGIPVPDQINFFANDYDTETRGLDIVATTDAEITGGSISFSVAYNYNETEVIDAGELTSDFKVRRLEEALPNHRATFTIAPNWGQLSAFVRGNFYGEYYAVHADSTGDGFDTDADSAMTFDAEVSYMLNDSFTVTAGAQNIFDQDAEKLPAQVSDWVGGQFYETSPYGINGGFYYLKGTYNF